MTRAPLSLQTTTCFGVARGSLFRRTFVGASLIVLGAACDGGTSEMFGDAAGGDETGTDDGGAGNPAAEGGASGNAEAGQTGPGDRSITAANVTSTSISLGPGLIANEDEAALAPVVLSVTPDGTSKVAWRSNGLVHITTIDGTRAGTDVTLAANDFSDFFATDAGGVVLLSRSAEGGGTLDCGSPANLCGAPPSPPVACFDEYLVGFEGTAETWATKVTSSSAALPPYSTSPTGPTVYMIWWYAHHGRIASNGSGYAAYFGDAISVSQGGCINIHQGDRMKVVDDKGAPVGGGFDLGCSHSGYERIIWDDRASKYVTVCKTDNQNRIAFAPTYTTIRSVDLSYSDFGDFVVDGSKASGTSGYWGVVSDIRAGQPAGANGLAEVHLMHFVGGLEDDDIVVTTGSGVNERAPHIARYGSDMLLVAWEQSSAPGELQPKDSKRELFVQARSLADGSPLGLPYKIPGRSNRYQSLVPYPDGSVGLIVTNADASIALVKFRPNT